jgi:cytochrome c oxidase assembly protein subunit 15
MRVAGFLCGNAGLESGPGSLSIAPSKEGTPMSKPRSIFEEVDQMPAEARAVPKGGMIDNGAARGARGAIRAWLFGLFALVIVMIIIGGLTRLTDSGLSITEWNLVFGTLPPMDAAAWASEFAKYQDSPEYRLQNAGMSLEAFKSIYWWEWGHRLLGRIIGAVWIIGFLGFLAARKIPTGWVRPLFILGCLIGIQGIVGWWMVHSGLQGERVDVASYRLATHLGLAFGILGLIYWLIQRLNHTEAEILSARRLREAKLFSMSTGLMHFAMLQILLGALVAGIDAGRSFVDWPLMGGQIFPPDAFAISPVWKNFFENAGLVQFTHRLAGYLLVIFGFVMFLKARKSASKLVRNGVSMAFAMLLFQMFLGIYTVLNAAPLHIAIAHQVGAIATWLLILNARFRAGYPPAQSVRG